MSRTPATGSGRAATWMLGALTIAALAGFPGSDELGWGFLYPSLLPGSLRVLAGTAIVLAVVPATSRHLRRAGSALADRWSSASPATVTIAALGLALAAFVLFQSRTLYGDSRATIALLEGGELINWKEPLDRFVTAVTYRLGHGALGWSAASAIAAVSTAAGLVWVGASLSLARTLGSTRADRILVVALLVTPGLMQLFFGNVENYSLLAAGTLVFLWSGVRFLRAEVRFLVPALALGVTCWIHLSAVWLLPTLPFLLVARMRAERAGGLGDRAYPIRSLTEGALGIGLPTLVVGGLAFVLPTARGPTLANFGGGDARLFVPLRDASGELEKFTLFGWDHLVALANEVLLVCPAAAIVAGAYLVLGTSRARRAFTADLGFVGLATLLLGAFSFSFNPDMAVFDVGVRNEWDLLAAPGVPLVVLAAMLLLRCEPDPERRGQVGVAATVASVILTGSWVLYNARILSM